MDETIKKRCLGCMEEYEASLTTCPHCGYQEGTPAKEAYHIPPGTYLGTRYLIGKVLGFGGFGVTYLGYDETLCVKVAIKEYLPSEFSTRIPEQTNVTIYQGEKAEQFASGMNKFLEEARKLAKFQSEQEIIHIFDCFEKNNTAYIVMEYLEGESLKSYLDSVGKISVEEALPMIISILEGLKKVHKEGMLHRDIAPDNIYMTKDGSVKIMDFGAARYAMATHTRSLTVMMKEGYSPVEQYQSRGNQGPWTDVYAVGATFYRMITGITPEESLARAIKDTLKPPSKYKIKIKKSQETALMNALVIQPEERTASAEEFENQLLASEVRPIKVTKKRNWFLISKIGLLFAAGAVAVAVGFLTVRTSSLVIPQWVQGTIPDGQVRVPNFVNDTVDGAMQRAEEAELSVQITDKEYSSEIPKDRILSQSLEKGSLQAKGSMVDVIISAGIEKTLVPEVTGLMKEEAEPQLFDAGLKATYQEEESWVSPGAVIEQSLDANSSTDTGTQILVRISKGVEGGDNRIQLETPDVTAMQYEEAGEFLIQDFVYLLREKTVYDDAVPKGAIISQEPAAGTQITQTSSVKVVVSLGKEQVAVPDVQYKTEEDALMMLAEVGLSGEIQREASREVASGNIIRQETEANSMTDKGSSIVIVISTGPPQEVMTPPANTGTQATERRTTSAPPVQTETQRQTEPQTTAPPPQTEATTEPPKQTEPTNSGLSDLDKLNERLMGQGL